ncbi:hypothetical protein IX51_10405 [uncultured archaeon]|nr:hypothetical protein IX51_10405 [uncultured archaeon]
MVKLKWLGHAAWLVFYRDTTIIIDPYLTNNPKAPMKADEIEKLDYIFITHDHFDHLGDAFDLAKRTGAKTVSIFEISNMATEAGVPQENAIGMNKGSGLVSLGSLKVSLTHADHSGHEVGFVIDGDGKTIYHAGDTALFGDMSLIGQLYRPSVAILPIGGFYTMGPREAAMAADLIGAGISIPMHYNTFPAIEQNPDSFTSQIKNGKGKVLKVGEEYEIP